jgi:transposase
VISQSRLREIERRIVARVIEEFGIDGAGLVLHMPKFATDVGRPNDCVPIPLAGSRTQRPDNPRLFGLRLVVSADDGIPFTSLPYPGNKSDITRVPDLVRELATQSDRIAVSPSALTVVVDGSQDCGGYCELMDELIHEMPLHVIASLPLADHPDLLRVPKDRYRVVDNARFEGLRAFEDRKAVFGAKRRIIVTYSEDLHRKQSRSFDQTLVNARRQLESLSANLRNRRIRKPRSGIEDEIAAILEARWLKRVISVSFSGEEPGELRLVWRTKRKARDSLEAQVFGKQILLTDKEKDFATVAQIVAEYRSMELADRDFSQIKDPNVVSFPPTVHMTDESIRLHMFICVLALMVARLMVREADRAGAKLTVSELIQTLVGIEETVLLYQGKRGRPRARRVLTEMEPTQRRLYELFGLQRYAP